MLLVYPERLGWAIGEEVFKQLASVDHFNFRVCREIWNFYCKGALYTDYLWRKIEVGTLYFSTNSRLTTLKKKINQKH